MPLKPATRQRVKARLLFVGMTKTGKSDTGLATLRGIVGPEGRIAAIDTENGNLSLYAGRYPSQSQPSGFDVECLSSFSPDSYRRVHDEAAAKRYDGFLIDSVSQEWEGKGGILEIVDGVTDKFFTGWKSATPKHNEFVGMIVNSPMHVVVTVRQKDQYIVVEGNAPKLVGTEPVQRKRFEYEFNAVMEMDHEHNIRVQYSLIPFLPNGTLVPPLAQGNVGLELGAKIREWLDQGDGEFQPPQYKMTFYVNGKERVSAGIERDTFVELSNLGVALNKLTKPGTAKAMVESAGVTKLEDLTQAQGEKLVESMRHMVEKAAEGADA